MVDASTRIDIPQQPLIKLNHLRIVRRANAFIRAMNARQVQGQNQQQPGQEQMVRLSRDASAMVHLSRLW